MNSTTADKRVRLPVILAISVAIQALGLALFYGVDALRVSRLEATAEDVRERDEQARRRLKQIEQKKSEKRAETELREKDAEKLTREERRKQARKIVEKLEEIRAVRDEMEMVEQAKLEEVRERRPEDVSNYFYYQLHPRATQLVLHAKGQLRTSELPAAPGVEAAARAFLADVEREKQRLVQPEVLDRMRALHARTRGQQHEYIQQLDRAQAAYAGDEARIRRENHVEYLVNLSRDQISGLLKEVEDFELDGMNELPPDYQSPPPLEPAWAEQLDAKSVADLHAEAAALQEDIRRMFKAARAAELAMSQNTSLAKAWNEVSMPPAPQRFSAEALPDPPRNIAELNAFREAMATAARDVHQMWQQARNIGRAGAAMRGTGGEGEGTGAASRGGAARAALLANAARGNLGRQVDVSPFMRGPEGEKGSFGAVGSGLDITHKSKRTGFQGRSDALLRARRPAALSEAEVLKQALPGRKFSRTSERTGWLYIDTWYVVGPWENDWKTKFDQPLPPETLVDLDAEYVGKNDRLIRWQFHQSDNIRIKPPRETEGATYYGYTEVYFEEGTEMLVAVASDDAAKVWINDTVVWQDRGFSPWRIDEGFRKVFFKQGFNTILVRIENGPVTCTYSVLLCPPERRG